MKAGGDYAQLQDFTPECVLRHFSQASEMTSLSTRHGNLDVPNAQDLNTVIVFGTNYHYYWAHIHISCHSMSCASAAVLPSRATRISNFLDRQGSNNIVTHICCVYWSNLIYATITSSHLILNVAFSLILIHSVHSGLLSPTLSKIWPLWNDSNPKKYYLLVKNVTRNKIDLSHRAYFRLQYRVKSP